MMLSKKKLKKIGWNMKKKVVMAVVLVAIMPLILGYAIIDGFIFGIIEDVLDEKYVVPTFDKVTVQKDLYLDLVKEQIGKNEDELTFDQLKFFDTNAYSNLLGFYVEKDGTEIYRSEWLVPLEIIENVEYGGLDVDIDGESEVSEMDRTQLLSLDHTYTIYTLYDVSIISGTFIKYVGIVLLFCISIFAVITFLLIIWIFRHMSGSLSQLKRMTENILGGDLESNVPYEKKDEFKELAEMIDTLRADLLQSNLDKAHLEKERERMLINITHDIKTPITAIKGCSQMLADDLVKDDITRKEYLDIILSRSHVIEHMVDDLKEVIKYDVGSIKLNWTDVNLKYFLEDCIDDFRINNKDQMFEINFDNDFNELSLRVDPNLLQRVFKNIIGNALKYNRDQFINITIKTHRIGNTIRFKITDDGVGVPDEALPQLFDRLYRVDSSRNSKIEGSGVGLSICKEIIDAHAGQIWAENENGLFGIVFSIPIMGGEK